MAAPRISATSLDRSERQVTIYRDDRYFTKNPDIVLLPGGKLLCVFNETDYHWPTEFSRITVIESGDYGATWGNPRIVDQAYRRRGEERWVTPRISRLRDGRLVIVCDQNDYQHCHESQPAGICAWWSEDNGDTWSSRVATGIPGIEPDRVCELEDGTLLVGSHYMFRATRKKGESVSRSSDGGKSWQRLSIVASDRVHHFVEGALLPLRSGRLVCVMRESNHNNYPSYLAFSDDAGSSWSEPIPAPFSGDRPFPGQLGDGRDGQGKCDQPDGNERDEFPAYVEPQSNHSAPLRLCPAVRLIRTGRSPTIVSNSRALDEAMSRWDIRASSTA